MDKLLMKINFRHCVSLYYPIPLAGMMYVEKTDDGSTGWVPGNITRELQSDHMRARNFKQRYQFLKALAELDMAET